MLPKASQAWHSVHSLSRSLEGEFFQVGKSAL